MMLFEVNYKGQCFSKVLAHSKVQAAQQFIKYWGIDIEKPGGSMHTLNSLAAVGWLASVLLALYLGFLLRGIK